MYKKIKIFFIVLAVTLVTSSKLVFAEDVTKNKLAIGFHGIGSTYMDGSPTIRWNLAEKIALDITPFISTHEESGGTADFDYVTFGLDVGMISKSKKIKNLKLGLLTELFYSYSNRTWAWSSISGSTKNKSFRLGVGLGPDLEYFIPAMPNLSIGGRTTIIYSYGEEKDSDQSPLRKTNDINLTGQVFTVRYYFK